ncbi:hypothetical protein [Streptomyces sp. NPDC051561]|uniref:hypothetical protein n=1 Tax=Streptomyces sp. NPDC051561 TaxID=3365658 RepID=UPI0037A26BD1
MPVLLLSAFIAYCFEQYIDWRYGVPGSIGILLMVVGTKARHPGCAAVGATVLAVTVSGPATG